MLGRVWQSGNALEARPWSLYLSRFCARNRADSAPYLAQSCIGSGGWGLAEAGA